MDQPLIALTGVSGIGKTTVLTRLAASLDFQQLRASSLITGAGGQVSQDGLRANASENQNLLLLGFQRARDPAADLIVLDAHAVLDTPEGLVRLDPAIFGSLDVHRLVMLFDEPRRIYERRRSDTSRSRPERSPDEIAEYQEASWAHCCRIATQIDVPFTLVPMSRIEELEALITRHAGLRQE